MEKYKEGFIAEKLSQVNNRGAYLNILQHLLENEDESRKFVKDIESKLQGWRQAYQTSLSTLLPKLAEIKQIAEGRQSELAFRAIVSKLDTWQGAGEEYAYELYGEAIKKWPSKFRIAPWSWSAALADSEPKRFWDLVAIRKRHPPLFYHSCYQPPYDTIIGLPSEAQNRLKLLSHIPTTITEFKANSNELHLNYSLRKQEFKKMMEQPEYQSIEELHIQSANGYRAREADHIISVLIDTGHMEKLKVLLLDGFHDSLTPEGFSLLVSAHTPKLESLSLSFSISIGKELQSIKILSRGNFPSLKEVDLTGGRISNECLHYLINSSWFHRLDSIKLDYNNITDTGLKYIAQSDAYGLRKIHLGNIDTISLEGIQHLIHSKVLANLWSLSKSFFSGFNCKNENLINNENLIREIASSKLRHLVELCIWERHRTAKSPVFSMETARKLAESPAFLYADHLFINYVDWDNACDGHGPEPRPCFDADGIDILRQSFTLRSSAKNELILFNEYVYDDDDEE